MQLVAVQLVVNVDKLHVFASSCVLHRQKVTAVAQSYLLRCVDCQLVVVACLDALSTNCPIRGSLK